MRSLITFLLAGLVALAPAAHAQSRHALVVGIDAYREVEPLQKARNDARAVHGALIAAGFEADLLLDSDGMALLTGLERFAARIEPGDEAVFFFAGHGVELDGENILLPADIPAFQYGGDLMLRRLGLPVADVLDQMQRRGARVSLLILDACRDNPFPRQGTRSLGGTRGLARMEAPEGAYIMYSAGAGQAALDRLSDDDPDPNSVFTRALLPRLNEPGLRLRDMVLEVRSEVRQLARTVNHDQFPAVYDQLDGTFFFLEGDSDQRPRTAPSASAQELPTPPRADIAYAIYAVGEPCDDVCHKGDAGMDLVATIDGSQYRVARYSFDNNVASMWIVGVRDLDNDGYTDVVYRTHNGGNALPPQTHIASYRGDRRFTLSNLEDYTWDEPELVPDSNLWRIRTGIVAQGAGNTVLDDELLEFLLQDGAPVRAAAAARSRLFTTITFGASDVPSGRNDMSWRFDLTGDGEEETLSCGYWDRWGLLIDCVIEYVVRGAHQSLPLPHAQCKEIGVLDERMNGFNQLVCDFDGVYAADLGIGAFLPVSAIRYRVDPELSLNVRAGPGADNNLLATLAPGTVVAVLKSEGEWVQIAASDTLSLARQAWVNSRFLVGE